MVMSLDKELNMLEFNPILLINKETFQRRRNLVGKISLLIIYVLQSLSFKTNYLVYK
jgi:hypothetical protein